MRHSSHSLKGIFNNNCFVRTWWNYKCIRIPYTPLSLTLSIHTYKYVDFGCGNHKIIKTFRKSFITFYIDNNKIIHGNLNATVFSVATAKKSEFICIRGTEKLEREEEDAKYKKKIESKYNYIPNIMYLCKQINELKLTFRISIFIFISNLSPILSYSFCFSPLFRYVRYIY